METGRTLQAVRAAGEPSFQRLTAVVRVRSSVRRRSVRRLPTEIGLPTEKSNVFRLFPWEDSVGRNCFSRDSHGASYGKDQRLQGFFREKTDHVVGPTLIGCRPFR